MQLQTCNITKLLGYAFPMFMLFSMASCIDVFSKFLGFLGF